MNKKGLVSQAIQDQGFQKAQVQDSTQMQFTNRVSGRQSMQNRGFLKDVTTYMYLLSSIVQHNIAKVTEFPDAVLSFFIFNSQLLLLELSILLLNCW